MNQGKKQTIAKKLNLKMESIVLFITTHAQNILKIVPKQVKMNVTLTFLKKVININAFIKRENAHKFKKLAQIMTKMVMILVKKQNLLMKKKNVESLMINAQKLMSL